MQYFVTNGRMVLSNCRSKSDGEAARAGMATIASMAGQARSRMGKLITILQERAPVSCTSGQGVLTTVLAWLSIGERKTGVVFGKITQRGLGANDVIQFGQLTAAIVGIGARETMQHGGHPP